MSSLLLPGFTAMMSSDETNPGFVQELGQSVRARSFIFRIGVAVGFRFDDPFDDGPNVYRCDGTIGLDTS